MQVDYQVKLVPLAVLFSNTSMHVGVQSMENFNGADKEHMHQQVTIGNCYIDCPIYSVW